MISSQENRGLNLDFFNYWQFYGSKYDKNLIPIEYDLETGIGSGLRCAQSRILKPSTGALKSSQELFITIIWRSKTHLRRQTTGSYF
jgi:hypothetical protein